VVLVVATTPGPDIFVPGKVVDPGTPVGGATVVPVSPLFAPVVVVVSVSAACGIDFPPPLIAVATPPMRSTATPIATMMRPRLRFVGGDPFGGSAPGMITGATTRVGIEVGVDVGAGVGVWARVGIDVAEATMLLEMLAAGLSNGSQRVSFPLVTCPVQSSPSQ